MLIPLHQLIGSLSVAINTLAATIFTDLASYSLLSAKLAAGDWTYLSIQHGSTYEIVKVTSVNTDGSVTVVRGQAPTTAASFPVGASVEFVMSSDAVADLVAQHQLGDFSLEGAGSVTVTQTGPTSFTISSPVITITGADDIEVTGSMAAGFVVARKNPIPCCPGSD